MCLQCDVCECVVQMDMVLLFLQVYYYVEVKSCMSAMFLFKLWGPKPDYTHVLCWHHIEMTYFKVSIRVRFG